MKQPERKGQSRDRAGGGGAQRLVDGGSFGPDRLKRRGDHGAAAVRPRPRDEVDQLAPAHGGVMTVLGRLIEDGQQTIVEAHWLIISL